MHKTLISRRGLLAGAALAAFAPRALAHDEDAALNFLVIGDWGEHSSGQIAVSQAMAHVADEIGSDFVISTGDNFYSRGVESVTDPQWTQTFEAAFAAPSLQTPWYAVLGNHDYRGSVDAELDYTIASPRWQMPSRYWRSDMNLGAETASFFFLDTFPLTHLPSLRARVPMLGDRDEAQEQLRWLERALAASNARWKIAVGHHLILSSGSHGGSETLYDHVRPLLERYGVRAYFNGHDHNLEYLSDGGVSYICSGAGSEAREVRAPLAQTRFAYGRGPGFVSCRLNSETLIVRFHDATGAVLYRTEIASTSA